MYYSEYINRLCLANGEIIATDLQGDALLLQNALDQIVYRLVKQRAQCSGVFIVGNGGSAAIASHVAIDLWKNGGIRAYSLNDAAQLTCLANDLGYENVFAVPLELFLKEGDSLIAISSSGNSLNIIKAVESARKRNAWVATFSGFLQNNTLRTRGDFNIYVPQASYGVVESIHAVLCHYILDCVIENK